MASISNDERWYFTKEQLDGTPSRGSGIEAYKELSYRQQAANFIQDMGQRLKVSQLCINTAIVYMHRFYVFHSFTQFPWHSIAAAALFLAAKVEEQPRKLEHVIRVANLCKNPRDTNFDTTSERYLAQSQDLVFNENVLLQTLGFDVAIDHPHTHVVRCCHLVRASKDLAQTSYFMASNSLHLTTMCLQYKPTVVACFCIHLACKWSNWEIPLSNENKKWFSYVDPTVTSALLQQLTEEFLVIFERCPSRLKEKIMAIGDAPIMSHNHPPSTVEFIERKMPIAQPISDPKDPHSHRHHSDKPVSTDDAHIKPRFSRPPHEVSSGSQQQRDREREYREKKERERLAHHSKQSSLPNVPSNKHLSSTQHGHHGHQTSVDPKMKQHTRPPSMGHQSGARIEPRDILREAVRDGTLKDHRDSSRDLNRDITRDSARESLTRDSNKDIQARSDKEAQKRDYLSQRQDIKPNSATDSNSVNNLLDSRLNYSVDKRVDASKQRAPVDPKLQQKQLEAARRRDEARPYAKADADIRKYLNAPIPDKNNTLLFKPINSTSQKLKSPFTTDMLKSVPNLNVNQPNSVSVKSEPQTSNINNSLHNLPIIDSDLTIKQEVPIKEEPIIPMKKPSLFSPEKTPPQKKPRTKTPPSSDVKQEKLDVIQTSIAKEMKPPDLIPPFNTSSNNSVSGPHHPLVNGIETNPTLISNLLKEAPSVLHLPAMSTASAPSSETKEKEHHHKERKKNKKEKHKHKDKDKSKEEKEKKKKHKDKDREKHKHKHDKRESEQDTAQPIKITIPKDKIHPPENPSSGLKIKIPKDRIKTDNIGESSAQSTPSGGLKIKISKEIINNFNSDSRKRERDKNSPNRGPPSKVSKTSQNRVSDSSKQNGKNSYNKVAQLGVGDTSIHRLAESKYSNKGAPT